MRSIQHGTRVLICAAVPMAVAAAGVAQTSDQALHAVDAAPIGIFAFRDARGRPMAWPITPYRDGTKLAVTSTLAFVQKAVHVHRDGRVALLAGGWHFRGQARVEPDADGEDFERRFLAQEIRKYEPTAELVNVPLHRWLFSWYFGRAIMEFVPDAVGEQPGSDAATLITLDAEGYPVVTPIALPDPTHAAFQVHPIGQGRLSVENGLAMVLIHTEPTPTDLRQLQLRGKLDSGMFAVRQRSGSLSAPPQLSWWGQLKQQVDFHRRGCEGRRILREMTTDRAADQNARSRSE